MCLSFLTLFLSISSHLSANSTSTPTPNTTKQKDTSFDTPQEARLERTDTQDSDDAIVVTRDDIRDVEKAEKDILGWVNDRRGSLRPPPVVADSFGETWKEKTIRILGNDKNDKSELVSLIAKSFDDLRQEVFTMQLIEEMKKIWNRAHVPVFVRSYTILSTSSSTGLIETITNATSLDALKKREGYVSLRKHFVDNYGPLSSPRFAAAQLNFLQSLAGYSILSYLIGFKDRHNGNLLIDNQGHILHIDFGFILGIAPGGKFSIETAPFKLTQEYADVLDGVGSPMWEQFVDSMCYAFLEARENSTALFCLVETMMVRSKFPCFQTMGRSALKLFKDRFRLDLKDSEVRTFVRDLASRSLRSRGTYIYDLFQRKSNGIAV
jgi:phosphatidylinositol 4-kinase B